MRQLHDYGHWDYTAIYGRDDQGWYAEVVDAASDERARRFPHIRCADNPDARWTARDLANTYAIHFCDD